jgi:hypothetical protein
MSPRFVLCLLGAAVATAAAEDKNSGGYGPEHLTEDRHAPVQRQVDDQKLLEMRKSAKFAGFTKEDGKPKGWDLNQNSEFISAEGWSTLVPKRAIIHVPESHRSYVTPGLKGEFLLWNEFASRYRGIVTTFEVSLEEVSGKTPISPERLKELRELDRIVVAVFKGSPISCPSITPAAPPAAP